MTILRLCPKCGATVDPAAEGYRGPCRKCERDRSRQRRATADPALRVRDRGQWKKARAADRARDRNRCADCGASDTLEVHHVTPLNKGGQPYDLRNLITLCSSCHHRHENWSGRRCRY